MSFEIFHHFLQNLSPEIILGAEYVTCCVLLIGMVRAFGLPGLFSYIALAVVIGNIQVLKAVHFSFLSFPVALGTIVFSSTFLAVDIVTEVYGSQLARKAVWMGFAASLMVTVLMTLTLGMSPAVGENSDFTAVHQAIYILFSPGPALFAASLISYVISQYADIWIFQAIRRQTGVKWLWMRTVVASLISALLDNVLFSTLAWVVFAKTPVSMQQLIFTYILGTYTFRVLITLLQTPLMYGVRALLKRDPNASLSEFQV